MDIDFDTIDRRLEESAGRPLPTEAELSEADQAIEFSEDDLALRFTILHGANWRYVATWGKWLEWDGQVWRVEKTIKVWDLIRGVCRTASALADDKIAAKIATAKTIAAVERIAQSDRRHAMTDDAWDADPWLLNTPAGVVNLQTGDIRPHDRTHYMTKMTAVGPSDDGCPVWMAFLDTVCSCDAGLIEYLQRVFGYALTGITNEHALFFCYGKGRNGKGTAINTVERIMASYASVAGMETFTASKHDRHLTELARLQGARLVTSQETEEGRAWAEARIKQMTGGDPMTANFMRKDHFTFLPIFKLIIAGNHKPAIKNLDEAMRARINLIPFTVTIPKERRDPDLPAKLEAEWPAILQWMIEGCLTWQVKRLEQPQAVIDATAEYFSEQDLFTQWLEQCCILHGTLHTGSTPLFKSWQDFAAAQNEQAGSQTAFSQKLKGMDLRQKQMPNNTKGFVGIGLRVEASEQNGRYGRDD